MPALAARSLWEVNPPTNFGGVTESPILTITSTAYPIWCTQGQGVTLSLFSQNPTTGTLSANNPGYFVGTDLTVAPILIITKPDHSTQIINSTSSSYTHVAGSGQYVVLYYTTQSGSYRYSWQENTGAGTASGQRFVSNGEFFANPRP